MRVMFAYHLRALRSGTVGSARDLYAYGQVAKQLGHEVVVYGPPDPASPFVFSLDLKAVDALIFVFEWTTHLRDGDRLDFARFMTRVPRNRRVVIDCDGAYNDPISADGDCNHRNADSSRTWSEVCDSLSDKICQPTLRPLRSGVLPFLFYGFDPKRAEPYVSGEKEYGMLYVGHSKLRWRPMKRVLRAIEPVRDEVGRLAVVGHGWGALPPWAAAMGMEDAFYTDQAYMRQLGVEMFPPIRFEQVIPWMSKALLNPVLMRPIFERLQLVTPRLFETVSASTIPLFNMEAEHVRQIYGEDATALILPADRPEQSILESVRRPERRIELLKRIRAHLIKKHSHAGRFKELLAIVES
jgi:hypothetical protein